MAPGELIRASGPVAGACVGYGTFGLLITSLWGRLGPLVHHHERVHGRGLPRGLSGDEIPEFARMIGVADAFDVMTSTRLYREARPVEEAVRELRRCSGSRFDPVMVEAFLQALAVWGWQAGAGGREAAGSAARAAR